MENIAIGNQQNIQQHIISLIELRKKHYLLDPNRIVEDYAKEDKVLESYDGRQLFEILQNADDAASGALGDKKAVIRIKGNTLLIGNTGDPFSIGGIDAILYSDLSPKFNQGKKNGAKGLGFKQY